jgi:hypothetical protein
MRHIELYLRINIGKSTCCQSDHKGKRRYVSVVVPTLTTEAIVYFVNGYYIYQIIITITNNNHK